MHTHSIIKPLPVESTLAPPKPRNERKFKALRKGWKGWVEVDVAAHPAPNNLIRLDQPLVLPERTTRSGRKI